MKERISMKSGIYFYINKRNNKIEYIGQSEYVEQHRVDSTTGFGQVFTPTNQIIGLTYCKPIDIE